MDKAAIIHVSDGSFAEEIEQHDGVAVLDLWAEWCGPCHRIAPVLEELAQEYAGKIKITKLDVDANPITMERFGVRSIPTLLFFRGGEVIDTVVGALPKSALAERFRKAAA